MARGERSENQTAIGISLPKELLAEIDALAAEADRSRSKWIVRELKKAIALRKAGKKTPAQIPSAAAVVRFSSSTAKLNSLNEPENEYRTRSRKSSKAS